MVLLFVLFKRVLAGFCGLISLVLVLTGSSQVDPVWFIVAVALLVVITGVTVITHKES